MDPASGGLSVTVTDALGRRVRAPGLASWLRRAAPARARGTVTVALVSDARMRALNRAYRGKDYATDVLSFQGQEVAQGWSPAIAIAALKGCATTYLGDIVIATGVAGRQARDQGHSPAVELRMLALHGLLHLLGYDHERDRGRMRRLEQRLLRRAGLRGGLIERARPSTSSGRAVSSRGPGKHARGEPFDSTLILSLSKDERLAQGRPARPRARR